MPEYDTQEMMIPTSPIMQFSPPNSDPCPASEENPRATPSTSQCSDATPMLVDDEGAEDEEDEDPFFFDGSLAPNTHHHPMTLSGGGGSSSLDILSPKPWVSRQDRAKVSPDAALLESLSRRLIECFCTQDWENPLLSLATPNFSAYIDHAEARVRSFDEHVEFHKMLHLAHPEYVYEVDNVSADVDDEKGLASVWALLTVTGYPAHIRRESLTVLSWRRRKGKWRCYKQLGIRGVNWFDS